MTFDLVFTKGRQLCYFVLYIYFFWLLCSLLFLNISCTSEIYNFVFKLYGWLVFKLFSVCLETLVSIMEIHGKANAASCSFNQTHIWRHATGHSNTVLEKNVILDYYFCNERLFLKQLIEHMKLFLRKEVNSFHYSKCMMVHHHKCWG